LKIESGSRNGCRKGIKNYVWNLCRIEIEKYKKTIDEEIGT
jgi:hypothetical protein